MQATHPLALELHLILIEDGPFEDAAGAVAWADLAYSPTLRSAGYVVLLWFCQHEIPTTVLSEDSPPLWLGMVENSEVVIIYPDNLILGDLKYFQYETSVQLEVSFWAKIGLFRGEFLISSEKFIVVNLPLNINIIVNRLVVSTLPLWKIWLRQLGGWHSQ